MSDLFAPVCSITTTKRRRFFWAAWVAGPPVRIPFRPPDASDGGASTFDEAKARADRHTGHTLVLVDPLWARAWIRILRGEPAWPSRQSWEPRPAAALPAAGADAVGASVWAILGLVDRNVSEEELKAAYRKRVLETHPDHGGDEAAFRRVVRAYADAQLRLKRPRARR